MSGESEFADSWASSDRAPGYRDTWDKPVAERRFLFKLDACLLTYAALSYFSK